MAVGRARVRGEATDEFSMAVVGTAQPFILGGIASLTAECGTFPIDTTKIRLQLQGQVDDTVYKHSRYRGMFHAFTRIAHEEGFGALYKGIAPALLRQASYGTLKMGLYQRFKRLLSPHRNKEGSLPTNIMAGMMAGVISSSVANPTDVLKVRMQAANAAQPTRIWTAFHFVYTQEGLRGLYRGVGPTALRAAVLVSVLMPTYDLTKTLILKYGIMEDHIGTHICASFVGGLLSTIATNPFDVVKVTLWVKWYLHLCSLLY